MIISTTTSYGLIAAAYVAKNSDDGLVLASDIAKEYDIPLEYLLKIMNQLVRGGILRSKRGPKGGFCMAKPATQINLFEIIEAVEGPMKPRPEMTELTHNAAFAKRLEKVCFEAAEHGKAVLEKAKLSSMLK
jgi:Rrf2 family protein